MLLRELLPWEKEAIKKLAVTDAKQAQRIKWYLMARTDIVDGVLVPKE